MMARLTQLIAILKSSPQDAGIRFRTAISEARLGEKDQAFEILSGLLAEHSSTLVALKANPSFDTLHDDPRFGELLRQIGLPQ